MKATKLLQAAIICVFLLAMPIFHFSPIEANWDPTVAVAILANRTQLYQVPEEEELLKRVEAFTVTTLLRMHQA